MDGAGSTRGGQTQCSPNGISHAAGAVDTRAARGNRAEQADLIEFRENTATVFFDWRIRGEAEQRYSRAVRLGNAGTR